MAKKVLKRWLPTTPRAAKPSVPESLKQEVGQRCEALIQKKKPEWIQPPNDKWGYVHDVYGK